MVTGSNRGEVIFAGGGEDTVLAGAGNDTLYVDGGTDELSGEAGGDVLRSDDDASKLYGGTGNDTLFAGSSERLYGGDWMVIEDATTGAEVDIGIGLCTVDFAGPGNPADLFPNASSIATESLAGRSAIAVQIDGSGTGASGITTSLGRTDLHNVETGLSAVGFFYGHRPCRHRLGWYRRDLW